MWKPGFANSHGSEMAHFEYRGTINSAAGSVIRLSDLPGATLNDDTLPKSPNGDTGRTVRSNSEYELAQIQQCLLLAPSINSAFPATRASDAEPIFGCSTHPAGWAFVPSDQHPSHLFTPKFTLMAISPRLIRRFPARLHPPRHFPHAPRLSA